MADTQNNVLGGINQVSKLGVLLGLIFGNIGQNFESNKFDTLKKVSEGLAALTATGLLSIGKIFAGNSTKRANLAVVLALTSLLAATFSKPKKPAPKTGSKATTASTTRKPGVSKEAEALNGYSDTKSELGVYIQEFKAKHSGGINDANMEEFKNGFLQRVNLDKVVGNLEDAKDSLNRDAADFETKASDFNSKISIVKRAKQIRSGNSQAEPLTSSEQKSLSDILLKPAIDASKVKKPVKASMNSGGSSLFPSFSERPGLAVVSSQGEPFATSRQSDSIKTPPVRMYVASKNPDKSYLPVPVNASHLTPAQLDKMMVHEGGEI